MPYSEKSMLCSLEQILQTFYPAGGADCFYRLLTTSVEFCYSFGTFCISFEFYTRSEYLNNVFRMLGSTKHLYAQCLTYALRSNNVKLNQTFIQPNPNVPETFFVSWENANLCRSETDVYHLRLIQYRLQILA